MCDSPKNDKGLRYPEVSSVQASSISLSDDQIIRTIKDNTQDTLYFKDINSRFLLNSCSHAVQFGLTDPDQMIGMSDADFHGKVFSDKARADELEIMRTGRPLLGDVEKWVKETGKFIWFSTSKYPLYNELGQIVGTWGTSRDITELKIAEEELERANLMLERANEKLKELSVLDELSGLYNRRNFDDILEKSFNIYKRLTERCISASFCVLIIDIDNFKEINDTYGHLNGDAAIKYLANLLSTHTRSTDYSFRYGGDEFAIILPDTDRKGGVAIAEKLRSVVERNILYLDCGQIDITISIGVACYASQENAKLLLLEADSNLYQSKREGKNRVT